MKKKVTPKSTVAKRPIFSDPKKMEYSVDDILQVIEDNIGYSPLISKSQEKRKCKEYNNARQTIRRYLKGKELKGSPPRNYIYNKVDVIRAFNSGLYEYFLNQADLLDEYKAKVASAGKTLKESIASLDLSTDKSSYEDNLKLKIRLCIMMDYIEKKYLNIDNDLIESDIATYMEIGYSDIDNLGDYELLAMNRLAGNYEEYYSIKDESKK